MSGTKTSGFASMTRETNRAIAQKGNAKVRANGTIHQWTSETARLAGLKGGAASRERRRALKELARCD